MSISLQEKETLKEVEAMLPFVAGDVVQIMGIGVDEESLLVGEGRVTTLPGGDFARENNR